MPSRRELLGGVAGLLTLSAGCLGAEESVAHCSSRSNGGGNEYLRRVAPIDGDEQVSLGLLVAEEATHSEDFIAVRVEDADGSLVASVPLDENRDMSELDPEDHNIFASNTGELYAIPLGPPPQHGRFTVAAVGPDGDRLNSIEFQFNCYSPDGSLP
ncbi:hypothetical protein [Halorussus pelagicus]|uniref:hypothetical protein n=1 Tax=Halorussus pelagicus TaxID=2505977 RepID=UPI000FFB686E|nr:hypothetical protein [Halorussus pelagicus]